MDEREIQWLNRARAGDREAFARLVEAYQGPVYNLCYRMLGSGSEAEDATQETFIRIYAKLHTYHPERKFVSWALSIASHYCIDRLRRRRDWLSLDDEPAAMSLPGRTLGPEETALRHEVRDEVQAAVNRLAPAYRVPLVLRYWYDLSYQEIAGVMGLTVQAVKSRLHRARLQISEEAAGGAIVAIMAAAVR